MRQSRFRNAYLKSAGVAVLGISAGCSGNFKDMSFKSDPNKPPKAPEVAINEDIKIAKPIRRKPQANMVCDFADATLNGKNYLKAEDFYRKALELDKNCDRAYAGLARVLGEQERTSAALELLKTGVQRCPKSAPIWNEIGVAKAKTGDLAGAAVAFENAVQYDAHGMLYKQNLGNLYAMTGKIDLAYENLAQTMPPAEARYRIAGILFSQGQADQSRKQLQTALRMDPKNQPAAEMFQAIVMGKPSEEIAKLAAHSMREDSDVKPASFTTSTN